MNANSIQNNKRPIKTKTAVQLQRAADNKRLAAERLKALRLRQLFPKVHGPKLLQVLGTPYRNWCKTNPMTYECFVRFIEQWPELKLKAFMAIL